MRSHADLKVQSSRNELGAVLSTTPSGEDQGMHFRFVVQDRPVVVGLGLTAWRAQCPGLSMCLLHCLTLAPRPDFYW